jgi:hypothetical protein
MDQISRRNVLGSLLQHDWVYRWKQIFRIAGLEPSVAMINREQRLKELANQMNSAVPGRTAVQDLWSKDLLVQKPDRNCELVRHNLIPAYSQETIPSPLPESRVGGLEEQCRRDKK